MITTAHSGGKIYTLAQSGTKKPPNNNISRSIVVYGNGFDLKDTRVIKGRAKRKLVSQVLALELVDIAKEKGNATLQRTFWNTYHCLESLIVANDRIYGRYCKNRLCPVCCAIRKAEIINKYLPIMNEWKEPYFLTLTVKAVPASKLSNVISSMQNELKTIFAKYRKQSQRKTGTKLMGVRSLECNFNPNRKTYNPHFHLIVPDYLTGEIIMNEWINRAKKTWVSPKGQKLVKVFNNTSCLIEIVKYSSKIFTEPDKNKKLLKGQTHKIYVKALYNIVSAMQGKRIFDRFGFSLPKSKLPKNAKQNEVSDYNQYLYDLKRADWIDTETNSPLTYYQADKLLNYILQNYMDTATF